MAGSCLPDTAVPHTLMQAAPNLPEPMPTFSTVRVETTARLHMGFIDMHGGLGRRFGSIGLSLDQPRTIIALSKPPTRGDAHFSGEGAGVERALEYARHFARRAGIDDGAHLTVEECIPEHAGLGSGTQLALAIGAGINALYGLGLGIRDIAALSGRGARSGIGVGTFDQGGLLVDGGRGAHTQVPPILVRMHFPEAWRVLLLMHQPGQSLGVHGAQEVSAFEELPQFPAEQAAHIARLILMQALPAVAEQEIGPFGQAISEIQEIVGRHFAPAQGGDQYASPAVAEAMRWLGTQGVGCTGQSSWGPTGFAIVGDVLEAERLAQQARQLFPQIEVVCCSAKNKGSTVMQESQKLA